MAVHSDASDLLKKEAKSRAGGHFNLTNKNDEHLKNGSILTLYSIIKHIMASSSDDDLASLFYNYKHAVPLRAML